MPDHRGKFALTYEGPYEVKKAFSRGALILADMDGHDFNMPTNFDAILWYFTWRSLSVHIIFMSLCQQKKKNEKKKKREKEKEKEEEQKQKIYVKR